MKKYLVLLSAGMLLGNLACKKFLAEKPDQKLATPAKLDDLDGLLENYGVFNNRYPSIGEMAANDYYLSDASWAALEDNVRYFYTWQFYDDIGGNWVSPYNSIYYTNFILEQLPVIKVSPTEENRKKSIAAAAHFSRAWFYFALSQLFVAPYDDQKKDKLPGLPLRLNTSYNEKSVRASMAETYNLIEKDLLQSVSDLPEYPAKKYRPSKPAAYALLARYYLSTYQFQKAGLYADSSLALYNSLINYNTINPSPVPFTQFNDEVIYDNRTNNQPVFRTNYAKIDSLLYRSFDENDLRKTLFFKPGTDGTVGFIGHYTGLSSGALFSGITTPEIYLTKAECLARENRVKDAMALMNTLLEHRWKTGTFTPLTANSPDEALALILRERRKELLFRNIRWFDLRRLSKDPATASTLTRVINNEVYKLEPGSPRYTFPIDRTAIERSGMEQNP
jgi:hypothetical protein